MPVKIHITESLKFDNALKFDAEKGIVSDVKVLGATSLNGVDYLPSAITSGKSLYENAVVYIDHTEEDDDKPRKGRKFAERFGKLKGIYEKANELYAKELVYNTRHHLAEQFVGWLETDIAGIGLSHNVDGTATRDTKTGRLQVSSIDKVYSVDLVDKPGTTRSLKEQEMVDPTVIPDPGVDTPAPGDATDHKTHLINAATALLTGVKDDTMSVEDVKKQLNDILAMLDSGSEPDEPATDTPKDEKEENTFLEALKKIPNRASRWAASKLLEGKRRKQASKLPSVALTEQFIGDLLNARDDKHAKSMIDDRMKLVNNGNTGPRSNSRTPPEPEQKTRLQEQSQDNTATVKNMVDYFSNSEDE